jgi:hypothetical protein
LAAGLDSKSAKRMGPAFSAPLKHFGGRQDSRECMAMEVQQRPSLVVAE